MSKLYAVATAPKARVSDPGYAHSLWLTTSPSFEILGTCLLVPGSQDSRAFFEAKPRVHDFDRAPKKAPWILKPQPSIHTDPECQSWEVERARSAYTHRVGLRKNRWIGDQS